MLVSSSAKIDQFRDTTEKVDRFVNLSERPISFRYLWTKYVVRAMDICEGLGYKTWRNFNRLIEAALLFIADRLESQERELSGIAGELEIVKEQALADAFDGIRVITGLSDELKALTARAEKAENKLRELKGGK